MVHCSEIQHLLPLYSDGVLEPRDSELIEKHLTACPLCRQRLDELKGVQAALVSSRSVRVPVSLLDTIKAAVAMEIGGTAASPQFRLVETKRDWMTVWLLPFSVGGIASVLLAFSMLWFILNSVTPNLLAEDFNRTNKTNDVPVIVAGGNPSPGEYANSRADVAYESPSVNPRGSLVELTKLLVSNEIRDDEVVVVADVFENGSAHIAEVVEPPRNQKAAEELERAFHSDLAYAPFVPAGMDQRSDRVRVVFRIQSVSVYAR